MNMRTIYRNASVSVAALAVAGVLAGTAWANEDVLRLQDDPSIMIQPSITYSGWNFSQLDQINSDNVGDLVMKWSVQFGVKDEYQAPPVIVNDTMYVITPKPNYVYALDLNDNGRIKWEYRSPFPQELVDAVKEVACCGAQTRGLNYAEGKLFFQTLSGMVIALDAETGEEVWSTQATDRIYGETSVGNGTVIGDLYIVGNAGGEFGARGAVYAFDINDGKLRWKYYNMGPNNEVGIGPRFQPFYADDQVPNPALDSWYGDSWKRGGGTVWGYFTYDPDLNMFYYSTGNCGPWNPDYRREWGVVDLDDKGGLITYRNNYCASLMARDATTGELIWAYNITPQDQWDLDEPNINPLVDLEIDGQQRKALVRAARNGFFYVWDRETGEIINDPWPFQYVDYSHGIDKETGRQMYDIDKMIFTHEADRRKYTQAGVLSEEEIAMREEEAELYATEEAAVAAVQGGTDVSWCPGIAARNWENDAYSPQTGLLYTATQTECRTMKVVEGEAPVPMTAQGYTLREWVGEPYYMTRDGEPADHKGELQANNPATGETVWRIEWKENNRSPILATAGNLVFQGGADEGTMRAIDASTGEILWQFRTGTGFKVTPVTYIGPDGQQYIAVIGSQRAGADVALAADAAPDAPGRYRREGSTLYVFGLHDQMAAAQ